MRVVQLIPGAGGSFYCENCLRDAGLLRALRALGHEPITVPLYLPLTLEDGDEVETAPVFFGGINVFLQQKMKLFRKTPRWLDRVFDAKPLLKMASRMAGMTDAKTLAETTLSMLRGEHGHQVKELNRLAAWLSEQHPPDIVCISNALLLGMAEPLRRQLGAAVVCSLQDEDIFLDALPEEDAAEIWATMRECADHVDAFIAVSHYYARKMAERLKLPDEKLHVVYNGIDVAGHEPAASAPDPPVLGYLERLCPEMGFDILIEAFILLKQRDGFGDLKLRLAGGWLSSDKPFMDAARRRLEEAGLAADVEFLENPDRAAKLEFLRSLTVLSVPARHAEAFGMYVIEALASGVPVVVPGHGAFPEVIEATGGGLLAEPEAPEAFADAIARLLADPEERAKLVGQGRAVVLRDFTMERMAKEVLGVYEGVLESKA